MTTSRPAPKGPFDLPPKPIYGAQSVGDPILDAAAACLHRKGFDNTSLEEVASEAGVSRTTLYRRFGNRESLFTALLWARARPFREWSRHILSWEGTIAERLETVFTHIVLEIQRVGWLDSSLRSGFSPMAARLMTNTFAQGADEGIRLLVTSLHHQRGDAGTIDTSEVLRWMGRQLIELATAPDWDEAALRERVRYFIVPVVVGDSGDPGLKQRLDAIEGKLDRLLDDERRGTSAPREAG